MERVEFLMESGERISCLLNPESLLVQRVSGARSRQYLGRAVSGRALGDEQLIYTGGGYTQLTLNLLFDVELAGLNEQGADAESAGVCALTAPIWSLSENRRQLGEPCRLPLCRFIWGKSWNIPGVVTGVAEKLDRFSATGVPRRSWLRMRFRRVPDSIAQSTPAAAGMPVESLGNSTTPPGEPDQGIVGSQVSGERIEQLAYKYYGDCSLWRALARFNMILDPWEIFDGQILELPPLPRLLAETTP